MKIKKLSPEVQSTLRTGISISDVTHCVGELVQNSLDAQATSIAVRLNLENFTLQVVDNGHGLTKEELDLIGQRYMTSKCYSIKDLKKNLPYYGFRGESLASIREACGVLIIISKTQGCENSYCKVFRAGKESHNAVVSSHNRLCVGTTVIIKDFLYNLPVKRTRIQPSIEMDYVRHCLIALSIVNYKVSFTLRNDVTKLVILQTQEFNSSEDALKFHCNLKESHSFISVSLINSPFKINAHISRETESSGSFHFIFVNGRLLKNKRIYEQVNKYLSKSFFLRNIGKEVRANDDRPKEKLSPVFIIHIKCPYSEYDITSDPKKLKVEFKRWDLLEKSLEKVVGHFVLSESSLNNKPQLSCILQQTDERDVTASTITNHNDHIVKSNVLCGRLVTRSISNLEVGENLAENDEAKLNICSNLVSITDENKPERKKDFEKSSNLDKPIAKNGVEKSQICIDNEKTSKKAENSNTNTGLKPLCYQQETNPVKTNLISQKNQEEEKKHGYSKRNIESSFSSRKTVQNVLDKTPHSNLDLKKTSSMICVKNSNLGVALNVSKHYNQALKRKYLTEHILTETESDPSRKTKLSISSSETVQNVLNKTVSKMKLHNNLNRNAKKNLSLNCDKNISIAVTNPFKVPKPIDKSLKRKFLTEHILTESEPDLSPTKKIKLGTSETMSLQLKRISVVHNHSVKKKHLSEKILTESESEDTEVKQTVPLISKKSLKIDKGPKYILPILSNDFFNDAIKHMFESQNVLCSLAEMSSKETTPMKPVSFQVKLSRRIKQLPNSNSLMLTQKNTLKYLDHEKGYVACSKSSHSNIVSQERSSTTLATESKTQNVRSKIFSPKNFKSSVNLSQDKNIKLRDCKGTKEFVKQNNDSNKNNLKLCKLNHKWKVFSPTFSRTESKRNKNKRSILKSNGFNKFVGSKVKFAKSCLKVKHVKSTSATKGNPRNLQLSSAGQVKKQNAEMLKQDAIHQIETHAPDKKESKIYKHSFVKKTKVASTKTKNDIDCNPDIIECNNKYNKNPPKNLNKDNLFIDQKNTLINNCQLNLDGYPSISNTKQTCTFVNRPSINFTPLPIFTGTINDSYSANEIQDENKQIMNSKCLKIGLSNNEYLVSPRINFDFSPILTNYNFHYQKHPEMHPNNSSFPSFEHVKYGKDNKYLAFKCNSNPDKEKALRSVSKVINVEREFPAYRPTTNLKKPQHFNFLPFSSDSNAKMHESKISGTVSNLFEHNPSSSVLQNIVQQDIFCSKRFKIIPNMTPEILKICESSPLKTTCNNVVKYKETHGKEPNSKKGIPIENTADKHRRNSTSCHETDFDIFPYNILEIELKEDSVKRSPEGNCEQNNGTHEFRNKEKYLSNTHAACVTCSDIKNADNASHSNHGGDVILENNSKIEINSMVDENQSNYMVLNSEELTGQCPGDINQNHRHTAEHHISNWKKEITSSGKVIYINNSTGMSSFATPKTDHMDSTFILENRHWFLPKGVSPILHINVDTKKNIKDLSETEKVVVENMISKNFELETIKWKEGSLNQGTDKVLNILSGSKQFGNWPILSLDFKKPCAFSSESLFNAQVLGQLDKKFIAALMQPIEQMNMFLVLFDQHAVDERIRLESLISGYKNGDGQLRSNAVNSDLEINLSDAETTLLKEFLPSIKKIGLDFEVQVNKVVVYQVPLCLYNRYIREGENKEWLSGMVTALVKQMMSSVEGSRGVMPSMPALLSELISTEACRGSIKFGDVLTLDLCKLLISKLASCEVPFQCAHGRPVLTPLVEIQGANVKDDTINLTRLSKMAQNNGM